MISRIRYLSSSISLTMVIVITIIIITIQLISITPFSLLLAQQDPPLDNYEWPSYPTSQGQTDLYKIHNANAQNLIIDANALQTSAFIIAGRKLTFTNCRFKGAMSFKNPSYKNSAVIHDTQIIFENCPSLSLIQKRVDNAFILSGTSAIIVRHSIIVLTSNIVKTPATDYGLRLNFGSIAPSTTSVLIYNNTIRHENLFGSQQYLCAAIEVYFSKTEGLLLGDEEDELSKMKVSLGTFRVENNTYNMEFQENRARDDQVWLSPLLYVTTRSMNASNRGAAAGGSNVRRKSRELWKLEAHRYVGDIISVSGNTIHHAGRLTKYEPDIDTWRFGFIQITGTDATIWDVDQFLLENNSIKYDYVYPVYDSDTLSARSFSYFNVGFMFNVRSLFSISNNILQQTFSGSPIPLNKIHTEDHFAAPGNARENNRFLTVYMARSRVANLVVTNNSLEMIALNVVTAFFIFYTYSYFEHVAVTHNYFNASKQRRFYGLGIRACTECILLPVRTYRPGTDFDETFDNDFAPFSEEGILRAAVFSRNVFDILGLNTMDSNAIAIEGVQVGGLMHWKKEDSYLESIQRVDLFEVSHNVMDIQNVSDAAGIQMQARLRILGSPGIFIHHNNILINATGNWRTGDRNPDEDSSTVAGAPLRFTVLEKVERELGSMLRFENNNVTCLMDRGQASALTQETLWSGYHGSREAIGLRDLNVVAAHNTVRLYRRAGAYIGDQYFAAFSVFHHMGAQNFGKITVVNNTANITAERDCPSGMCAGVAIAFLTNRSVEPYETIETLGMMTMNDNNFKIASAYGSSAGMFVTIARQVRVNFFARTGETGTMMLEHFEGIVVNRNRLHLTSSRSSFGVYLGFSGTIWSVPKGFEVRDNDLEAPDNGLSALYGPSAESQVFGFGCSYAKLTTLTEEFEHVGTQVVTTRCTEHPTILNVGRVVMENNRFVGVISHLLAAFAITNFREGIILRNNTGKGLAGWTSISQSSNAITIDLIYQTPVGLPVDVSGYPHQRPASFSSSSEPTSASNYDLPLIQYPTFRIPFLNVTDSEFVSNSTYCGDVRSPAVVPAIMPIQSQGFLHAPLYQIDELYIENVKVEQTCQKEQQPSSSSLGTQHVISLNSKKGLVSIKNFEYSVFRAGTDDANTNSNNNNNNKPFLPLDLGVSMITLGNDLVPLSTSADDNTNNNNNNNNNIVKMNLKNVSIMTPFFNSKTKKAESNSAHDKIYELYQTTDLLPSTIEAQKIDDLLFKVHCLKWNEEFLSNADKITRQSSPLPLSDPRIDLDFPFCVEFSSTMSSDVSLSLSKNITASAELSTSVSATYVPPTVPPDYNTVSIGENLGAGAGSIVSGMSSAATNIFKTVALSKLRSCFNESYRFQPLGIDANIFMMGIGSEEDELRTYRGSIIGNFLFCIVMAVVFVALSALFFYYKTSGIEEARRELKRLLLRSDDIGGEDIDDQELQELLLHSSLTNNNNNDDFEDPLLHSSASGDNNNNNDLDREERIARLAEKQKRIIKIQNLRKIAGEKFSFLDAREFLRFPGVIGPVAVVVGLPTVLAMSVLLTVAGKDDFDFVLSLPSMILFLFIFIGACFWCAMKCNGFCAPTKRSEKLVWTVEGFEKEMLLRDQLKQKLLEIEQEEAVDSNNDDDFNLLDGDEQLIRRTSAVDEFKKKLSTDDKMRLLPLTGVERNLKRKIQRRKRREQLKKKRIEKGEIDPPGWYVAIWNFWRHTVIGYLIFEPKEWKESSFVLQFGIMFDSYNYVIFAVIDFSVAAAVAITAGKSLTCVGRDCCNAVAIISIVICFFHMIAVLYWRPYIMRVERVANMGMVVVTFISSCLVLAELHKVNVGDFLNAFAQISVGLSFLTVVIGMQPLVHALAVVFWRMYKKRMRDRKGGRFGDISSSDDDDGNDDDEKKRRRMMRDEDELEDEEAARRLQEFYDNGTSAMYQKSRDLNKKDSGKNRISRNTTTLSPSKDPNHHQGLLFPSSTVSSKSLSKTTSFQKGGNPDRKSSSSRGYNDNNNNSRHRSRRDEEELRRHDNYRHHNRPSSSSSRTPHQRSSTHHSVNRTATNAERKSSSSSNNRRHRGGDESIKTTSPRHDHHRRASPVMTSSEDLRRHRNDSKSRDHYHNHLPPCQVISKTERADRRSDERRRKDRHLEEVVDRRQRGGEQKTTSRSTPRTSGEGTTSGESGGGSDEKGKKAKQDRRSRSDLMRDKLL